MTYQGAPGDLIKAAVDNGARGIVIASAGAGATSGTQNEGIQYALGKKVFVVTSTRTGSAVLPPAVAAGLRAPWTMARGRSGLARTTTRRSRPASC